MKTFTYLNAEVTAYSKSVSQLGFLSANYVSLSQKYDTLKYRQYFLKALYFVLLLSFVSSIIYVRPLRHYVRLTTVCPSVNPTDLL